MSPPGGATGAYRFAAAILAFTSSNQFSTTLTCDPANSAGSGWITRKRDPSGAMSYAEECAWKRTRGRSARTSAPS